MKKGLTELIFILDRSGSMAGLESDTIGGFNGMIAKQKEEEGEANITTVLFDDRYELIHDRFSLKEVSPLTARDYYVRGCTALLDAMGKTIERVKSTQKHLPKEARAEKVIFVITTDGLENASHEYTYDKVRKMIRRCKKDRGWEFLFLGANMDAVSEAAKFGIGAERSVTFENDSIGVQTNYRVVGETISCMRASACMAQVDGSWKKEIEEDYKKRGWKKRQ
ncbi:MAG: vWA domain-containing protein [Ruminococcus sp.]|jgi:hypothetical protein